MNIIICPACGKENDGVRECTRCGCELSILEMISRTAEQELFMGKESLVNGDIPAAMHHTGKSWHLKKSPEAARLAFLSALAAGDFEQAGRWYVRTGEIGALC
ncbi:MAG: hypothetical protein COX51_04790 [Syntrophobacteraceae bacterium CG23_combo_of_CG06-09_8_20_14_all_50_8]|nr:MAG: hypothetical protein COX51_04790 [Syntrophobacteraceae bacterium CG23_combo_of_CG06-09_8_20_14_all_50_8]